MQPAVDAINDILVHYGFENFHIEPLKNDPNCYQIVRNDGTLVGQTLSEGEVTFITFLYYLQLVNGGDNAENVLEDRILVIDDPISSLDSTVLFIVSSLIKEVIKRVKKQDKTPYNVKQIILLTHNAYFHKEVSFVDGRYSDKNDVGYWLIRKINNESKIICCDNNNPIRGSYEMLWDELREVENLSLITVQNTMRRIIEVYFKTMGDYKDEDILDKIEKANEKEICRSLMVWINDGSHCVPDDIFYVPNDETVDNYTKVFRDIFEKLGHIGHYNMMMKEDIEKPKRRTYAVGVVGGVSKGLTE